MSVGISELMYNMFKSLVRFILKSSSWRKLSLCEHLFITHNTMTMATDEFRPKILQKFQNKKTAIEIYFCLAAVHVTVTLNWETRAVLIYNWVKFVDCTCTIVRSGFPITFISFTYVNATIKLLENWIALSMSRVVESTTVYEALKNFRVLTDINIKTVRANISPTMVPIPKG